MGGRREALAARRKTLGYTQERFAVAVGVDSSTVRRWESGGTAPQPTLRPRIARLLQLSLDELDALLGEPVARDEVAVQDKQAPPPPLLPESVGVVDPTAKVDLGAEPDEFLDNTVLTVEAPRRVGAAEVEQIRLITRMVAASENLYGGGMAGEAGLAHLRWASRLLDADADSRVKSKLYEAVGNLAGVVAFSAFDVGRHQAAKRCFEFGLWCADKGGSWDLRAATLADMARQAIYVDDLESALTLIEYAQVRADRLTPTARAMIGVIRARLLAMQGRYDEVRAEIDKADLQFADRDADIDPPWLTYYDAAEHSGSVARALTPYALAQRRPGEAAERLATAIRLHDDAYPRSRAFSRTRLATLHMTIGDPHEAVAIGRQALADATTLHSHRMNEELIALGRASRRHLAISEVADLSDSLKVIMSDA